MPAVGEILGDRYRIDAPLGAGGMATVHRAHDLRLGRDVAVKVLLPNLAQDPLLAERFDREARALASVRHPGIVAVHDVDPGDPAAGREPFFVMELCEGGSLADRLAAAPGGRLPPDETVPILVSVAAGLAELHGNGIVHRDVKPHNVLLAANGSRLGDFGVARSEAAGATTLTTDGSTVGTLAYLAPEVLGGEPATPASDVYGLGVVAWQALTGRLPRPAGSWTELVEARSAVAPPVSSVAPELGDAFDRPLAAALAPDPAERPDPVTFAGTLAAALGTWSRSRRGDAGRRGAPAAAAVPVPLTDDDSPTQVDVPTVTAAPVSEGRTPTPAPRRPNDRGMLGVLALGALGLGVLALILLGLGSGDGYPPAGASPSGVAAASVSPSPVASPSPSPSPSPAASPDAWADARARVRDVHAAIAAVRGGGGLKGKDANELEKLAGEVDAALRDHDAEEAADSADKLVEKVEEHIKDGEIRGDAARRLLDAARALHDAIPAGD